MSKPKLSETPRGQLVRVGLLKGRIRDNAMAQSPIPRFIVCIGEATVDDLTWALNLLIKHPGAKRTHRKLRIKAIADELQRRLNT